MRLALPVQEIQFTTNGHLALALRPASRRAANTMIGEAACARTVSPNQIPEMACLYRVSLSPS
jgi:hypothetical protein